MKNELTSKRIQIALSNANMKPQELADKSGVGKASISQYVNGSHIPGNISAKKIGKVLHVSPLWLMGFDVDMMENSSEKEPTTEYNHIIQKYRFITEHSPEGSQVVDTVLDREYSIADRLRKQAERIANLESNEEHEGYKNTSPSNIIEFQPNAPSSEQRMLKYFHSASAGTGVFILGNEVTDQIAFPERPGLPDADYAIKVNGNSMEPDYNDGDIVLVSQRAELRHGDVGIFIMNSNAYIKEYGEHALISRNPEAGNIMIHEYDNIVCMGKVVGKLEEPYEIISL